MSARRWFLRPTHDGWWWCYRAGCLECCRVWTVPPSVHDDEDGIGPRQAFTITGQHGEFLMDQISVDCFSPLTTDPPSFAQPAPLETLLAEGSA